MAPSFSLATVALTLFLRAASLRHNRAASLRHNEEARIKPVIALSLAIATFTLLPGSASASAPAGTATVHPGVQTFTEGAQCTSNFVFEEGSTVFIGQAAHCSGTGGQTETDGCTSGSLPLGTPVEVSGASDKGTLAYNSWLTMQADGESDADTCAYNDLA